MKILIVEDDDGLRMNLQDILELHGHQVLVAEDGIQGLAMAAQRPEFIFCDVDMPNLDGHGLLAGIKQIPGVCDVPFVFVTGRAERDQLRHGMTLGADDYITKPYSQADILGAIAARTKRQGNLRERVQVLTAQHQHAANAQWSHELLTPLNAILGSLAMIEEEADTIDREELKEVLAIIRLGAERQERLSRKLIRYFHLEQLALAPAAGKFVCKRIEAALQAAATEGAQVHDRAADLQISVEPGAVAVSEDNVRHAVAELVENAATFSKPGTPIGVRGTARAGRYRIEVTDQGPGMTEEQRAQIGAFVQFDRKVREQQGLGLGLAIARALAKLAGGQLILENGPDGRGLKVILDLPLAAN